MTQCSSEKTGGADQSQYYEDMAKEFADDVSFKIVERSGHWMPEENPEGFYQMVKEFLEEKKLL